MLSEICIMLPFKLW